MNIAQRTIKHLREELERTKRDLNQYKNVYRNECDDRRQQERRAVFLQNDNVNLQEQIDNLTEQVRNITCHINSSKVSRGYKRWSQLTSPVSKSKRKAQFRKCIEQSLMHLTEVKRVCVQLRIANEDVVLIWAQNHLRLLRNRAKSMLRNNTQDVNQNLDKNNAAQIESEYEDEIAPGKNDPDAFLSDGTWNPVHIKRIINVMDLYKISREAYHELRMTSRSILPSISRVKNTKKFMSNEIECLYHRTVRIQFIYK